MKYNFLTLASVLTLTLGSGAAWATEGINLSRTADTPAERGAYHYEFDRDEQCQGYDFGVKRLGITDPCGKKEVKPVTEPVTEVSVVKEYSVYFDLDKSDIRKQDQDVLVQASTDIKQYQPSKVVVVGHADTSGAAAYNEALSKRRAQTVSKALTGMGVENYVLDEKAMGEMAPAVETGDGVRLQENRFVSIKFLK